MANKTSRERVGPRVLGDEHLNEKAMAAMKRRVGPRDEVVMLAGFDFSSKVVALTTQKLIIADEAKGGEVNATYDRIVSVTRSGRTLIIRTSQTEHQYRMGNEYVVQELVDAARFWGQKAERLASNSDGGSEAGGQYEGETGASSHQELMTMWSIAAALEIPIGTLQEAQEALKIGDLETYESNSHKSLHRQSY